METVLTTIEDRHLEGYRLIKAGQPPLTSRRISEITREGTKIVNRYNFADNVNVAYLLVHKFLDRLGHCFFTLANKPGFLGRTEPRHVVMTHELVQDLMVRSLTQTQKPRLMPLLIMPPRDQWVNALDGLIKDNNDFAFEHFMADITFKRENGGYRVRRMGDRGEIYDDHWSLDFSASVCRLVDILFKLDEDPQSPSFLFDPSSITQRHF